MEISIFTFYVNINFTGLCIWGMGYDMHNIITYTIKTG